MDDLEQVPLLKNIALALADLSEANGSSLDALLALLPTLGPAGLLEQKEDGKYPFMEAVKAQHRALHDFNYRLSLLLSALDMDEITAKLSPQPSPPEGDGSDV